MRNDQSAGLVVDWLSGVRNGHYDKYDGEGKVWGGGYPNMATLIYWKPWKIVNLASDTKKKPTKKHYKITSEVADKEGDNRVIKSTVEGSTRIINEKKLR